MTLALLGFRRLFCGPFVAFVPCSRRVALVRVRPGLVGLLPASRIFAEGEKSFFCVLLLSLLSAASSTRFLPSSFSVTDDGLDTKARPSLLPLFPPRVLLFSSRSFTLSLSLSLFFPLFHALSSATVSVNLSLSLLLCPFLLPPSPFPPSSSHVPAASSYTSPGSRLLLVSFSPRRAGLFAGVEASPGLLENGRTRGDVDEDERG